MKSLTPAEVALLAFTHQHRIVTAEQGRSALHPDHQSDKATTVRFRNLRRLGLVDAVRCGSSGSHAYFTTNAGARAAEDWGVQHRQFRITPAQAAGPLQAHTLRVNDVGIAFLAAARAAGHECGPHDWHHEVLHRPVQVDAVLRYDDGAGVLVRWIELDRGTEHPDRLRAKVHDYIRLADSDRWRTDYLALPKLVIVLCDKPPGQIQLRLRRALDLCAADPAIGRSQLEVSFTTLADLQSPGPWAPVFWRPGEGNPVDLLGRAEQAATLRVV